MPDILQTLLDHKEVLGVATSAVGVVKTAYDMIQSRSRASTRDKLLLRIQGLLAARQAMSIESAGDSQDFGGVTDVVKSQLSEALTQFGKASREVRESQVLEGELPVFQRVLLLYKPASTRAWVPHIICWVIALLLPFGFLGTWFPSEGEGNGSWATFVHNWKDPDTYFGFLFFFGVFLLARSWGVWERKIYLKKQSPIAVVPRRGFRLATVGALIYGGCGAALLVGAVAVGVGDTTGGIKLGVIGLVIAVCGLPLYVSGTLRDRQVPLTRKKAIFLVLPALLLALASIFDIDGVILKDFRHDILSYWRSWIDEPAVPLFLIPFAALPVYAGVRCLRSVRQPQSQEQE